MEIAPSFEDIFIFPPRISGQLTRAH